MRHFIYSVLFAATMILAAYQQAGAGIIIAQSFAPAAPSGPSLPVIEGQGDGVVDNAASYTVAYPASVAEGDLLLMFTSMDGNDSLTDPAGWTVALTSYNSNDVATGYVHYKIADGTETGSLTVNLTASERGESVMFRITGFDAGSPVDVSSVASGVSTTTVTLPAYTTTEDNTLVFGATSLSNGGRTATFSGSWTQHYNNDNTPGGTGTGTAALSVASYGQATAGSTIEDSVTISSSASVHAWKVAVAPDPGITYLDFDDATISSYSSGQDNGTATLEDDGFTIFIDGNAWKKAVFSSDFTITASSVLEFEMNTDDEHELLSVGLDNDNDYQTPATENTFQLSGSDTHANWNETYNDYVPGSGWQSYSIDLSILYSPGTYSQLAFVADDDADATVEVRFRNVRIYEP